jgi:uncharacterized membrane protein YesL
MQPFGKGDAALEFRGIMGGFYRISEWIMRLSVINLLWVVCSFPVFFLGLNTLLSPPEYFAYGVVLISVLTPFTLFPATAAMFTVARKWVTGDVDVPLFKTFFRGYKENYVQAMFGGIVFVLLGAVMYFNYTFYLRQSGALGLLAIFFIVLAFVMFAAMFHFFSIMVHFHMKFWQIVKNAFLITIGNPVMAVLLIVTNLIVIYFSFYHFTFLIPFFMGSLMATASFWNFYRIFDRIKTISEREKQKREEQSQAEETRDGGASAAPDAAKHTDSGEPESFPQAGSAKSDGGKPGDSSTLGGSATSGTAD